MYNYPCSAQSAAKYLQKENEREVQPKIHCTVAKTYRNFIASK